jgi:hypothetical protein
MDREVQEGVLSELDDVDDASCEAVGGPGRIVWSGLDDGMLRLLSAIEQQR